MSNPASPSTISSPGIGRLTMIAIKAACAVMIVLGLVSGVGGARTPLAPPPAVAASYGQVNDFPLKYKDGKSSGLFYLYAYRIKGTSKFAIEARTNGGYANKNREFYGSVYVAYPNGSLGRKVDSDSGKGPNGTRLIKFTMKPGQSYQLYARTKAPGSKKREAWRTIIVTMKPNGDLRWSW